VTVTKVSCKSTNQGYYNNGEASKKLSSGRQLDLARLNQDADWTNQLKIAELIQKVEGGLKVKKRNFDELDGSRFGAFYKRNFDQDQKGIKKRNFDGVDGERFGVMSTHF